MASFDPFEDPGGCCLEDTTSDSSTSFPLKQFHINFVDIIGKGTFGIVYRGRDKRRGGFVAGKRIQASQGKEINDVLTEIKNLQKIKYHPCIVQLLDYAYFQGSFWMIMEFCELGDLNVYFKKQNPTLATKLQFLEMSAKAIAHMHGQEIPVIHRDIKPANIMLTAKGGVPQVKIADFGLAKIVDIETVHQQSVLMETQAGTPGFMAPEFFASVKYTKSVDVFALGLVLLAMFQYSPQKPILIPLMEKSTRPKAIGEEMFEAHRNMKPLPSIVSDDDRDDAIVKGTKELIRDMTCYNPKERLKATEVITRVLSIQGKAPSEPSVNMQLFEEKSLTETTSGESCVEVSQLPDSLSAPDEVYQYFEQFAQTFGGHLVRSKSQFLLDQNKAVLSFTSSEVVRLIVNKSHKINDKSVVTTRFFREEKDVIDPQSMVIRSFSIDTTKDELQILVSEAADLTESDPEPQIFFSNTNDTTTALVMFPSKLVTDVEVIVERIEFNTFKGEKLKAEKIYKPKQVLIEGLPNDLHEDVLRGIIGRKLEKEQIKSIQVNKNVGTAIVSLKTYNAVEQLQNVKIGIKGKTFLCFPFYPDLGIAVGKDEMLSLKPQPIKVAIPSLLYECFHHSSKYEEALNELLAIEVNAKIVFQIDRDVNETFGIVTCKDLSPLPQTEWERKAAQTVLDFCQSFTEEEVLCSKSFWEKVSERIKHEMMEPFLNILEKDGLMCIKIIERKEEVERLKKQIQGIIKSTSIIASQSAKRTEDISTITEDPKATLIVYNIPLQIQQQCIHDYFDSQHKMGVKNVWYPDPNDQSIACVTFNDQDAVEPLLNREHVIQGTKVDIQPKALSPVVIVKIAPIWAKCFERGGRKIGDLLRVLENQPGVASVRHSRREYHIHVYRGHLEKVEKFLEGYFINDQDYQILSEPIQSKYMSSSKEEEVCLSKVKLSEHTTSAGNGQWQDDPNFWVTADPGVDPCHQYTSSRTVQGNKAPVVPKLSVPEQLATNHLWMQHGMWLYFQKHYSQDLARIVEEFPGTKYNWSDDRGRGEVEIQAPQSSIEKVMEILFPIYVKVSQQTALNQLPVSSDALGFVGSTIVPVYGKKYKNLVLDLNPSEQMLTIVGCLADVREATINLEKLVGHQNDK